MYRSQSFRFRILGIFLSFIVCVADAAIGGKIAGKVTDQKTGETLIGASVIIQGTSKAASTNVEGRYNLANIAVGKYVVLVKYIGYQAKSIADVVIEEGKTTSLDIIMEEDKGTTLKEVTIKGSYKQEKISTLYIKQITAPSFSDGISAEQIKRSPDRSTSDVIKRVSGASIQDNKFVIVRGLSDRYNATMLNSTILPSTEPDKRAFSFDIIPSNMIDNIIISKTATPDMPADFAGGIIQVITKDVPDDNYFTLNVGTGFNTISTFQNMAMDKRSSSEFIGIIPSDRTLPNIPSKDNFNNLPFSERAQYANKLGNSFAFNKVLGMPARSLQASWGNSFSFKSGSKLGSILALTYNANDTRLEVERSNYLASGLRKFNFIDNIGKSTTTLGGLLNLAWIKQRTKISFKNMYNSNLEHTATDRSGIDDEDQERVVARSSDLIQRILFNSQLEGDHRFGKREIKLNWNVGYSYVSRSQPDLRTLVYQYAQDADPSTAVLTVGATPTNDAMRFFSNLDESTYSTAANLTYPFHFNKEKSNIKIGFLKQYKDRNFSARTYGYVSDFGMTNQNKSLPFDQIVSPDNLGIGKLSIVESTQPSDKYNAIFDLNAVYGMLDLKAIKSFRVVVGARFESAAQDVGAWNPATNKIAGANRLFQDFLPSVNFTYNLNKQTNLRLAAYQTVTKPELRELANFAFWDFVMRRTVNGNPDLQRSKNTNLDVRYEYYPQAGQIFSLSAYYKIFQNPIEQRVLDASTFTFQNAEKATTWGIEAEMRKNFDFVDEKSKFWNNLVFYANAALIYSQVNLNNLTSAVSSRALQGQSPYLINTGLLFNDVDRNLSVSVLYNRIGDRIAEVGFQGYADIYEKGRNVVDIQLTKKLLKNKAEVRLNVSDIINNDVIFYQDVDGSKSYDSNKDNLMNKAKIGRNIGLTFIYNIGL